MPRARFHIVLGIGPNKPLLRDTLSKTAHEAKILAVNSMRRDYREYDDAGLDWATLHKWGFRCVPINVSYRIPSGVRPR